METPASIYLGNHPYVSNLNEIKGVETVIQDETYYKISGVDKMRPFFMSIVSNSDHWMFISSNGGVTAGRINSDQALFPYYTDDKISESSEHTGSKSILLIEKTGHRKLWEPFSDNHKGVYLIERNLYKNSYGDKVIFEEINHDLALKFSYRWASSEQYGFVRHVRISTIDGHETKITVLDGLQNIMPYGVPDGLQNSSSNLVDAYKRCELEGRYLGIYSLSAIISDKAEPSEALKANVVWSYGFERPTVLLSSKQIDNFRRGFSIIQEIDIKAERGAYFICDSFELSQGSKKEWAIVANLSQSISDVVKLRKDLSTAPIELGVAVNNDITSGTDQLIALVAASDGLEFTRDRRQNIRHFANTTFNIMRGGIFDENYQICRTDFITYIERANCNVFQKKEGLILSWPKRFDLFFLREAICDDDDSNFRRLCLEYLPLKFSRRHGDPSRPWNKFSINLRNEDDGSKILDYQGNWRDIFQNWEALAHAYPEFIEGMIFKFINATTFDGYNPYRVFKDGFEWETIEPDNPWSYIGYWGDHQIIYLLKFLEFIRDYYPEKLELYLKEDSFVYANVPYRIKPYEALLEDPKNTIEFDHHSEAEIQSKKVEIGADGSLLCIRNHSIYKVNFIEKILATTLSKMANFIPEGGIWMNTQRPEWNDANNALVGNGASMVTLYYLRRFLVFLKQVISGVKHCEVLISDELLICFKAMKITLNSKVHTLNRQLSNLERRSVLDGLGKAASAYRNTVYNHNFSGKKSLMYLSELTAFIDVALAHLEHSIAANKRQDNLYHAYNLMTVSDDGGIMVTHLPEMLEGQVAVLSSGLLKPLEALEVLDALKASALFRKDQYSYILYPNKSLPRFFDKNNIEQELVKGSSLLSQLLASGNKKIIIQDCEGGVHFNGTFNNVTQLKKALSELPDKFQSLVNKESDYLQGVYEKIFNHKTFTGRSGTFFGYEGLGSIYWHMVSKLRLAVFEVTKSALESEVSTELTSRLIDHYFQINLGIGSHKSPDLYGAFPTDPYSHTPGGKGAQQPGMTGQVKEDLLCRFGELGVRVNQGSLSFDIDLLTKSEFLTHSAIFNYVDINQNSHRIELPANSLAYTICQVPVIYILGESPQIQVFMSDGQQEKINGLSLTRELSQKIFKRTDEVIKINVTVVYEN